MSYAKLHEELIASSIWSEPPGTRLVWITLLALANKHGEFAGSILGLARLANVSVEEAEEAVHILSSPDPHSRNPENEGRRIAAIPGGWELLNYHHYRRLKSKEEARERNAERQRRWRERNAKRNDGGVTRNENNAQSNATVTHRRDIAEAEAEAEVLPEVPSEPLPPRASGGARSGKAGKVSVGELLRLIPTDWHPKRVEAAADWAEYKQDLPASKAVRSLASWRKALARMGKRSPDEVADMVERAIANGWQGWEHESKPTSNANGKTDHRGAIDSGSGNRSALSEFDGV